MPYGTLNCPVADLVIGGGEGEILVAAVKRHEDRDGVLAICEYRFGGHPIEKCVSDVPHTIIIGRLALKYALVYVSCCKAKNIS